MNQDMLKVTIQMSSFLALQMHVCSGPYRNLVYRDGAGNRCPIGWCLTENIFPLMDETKGAVHNFDTCRAFREHWRKIMPATNDSEIKFFLAQVERYHGSSRGYANDIRMLEGQDLRTRAGVIRRRIKMFWADEA